MEIDTQQVNAGPARGTTPARAGAHHPRGGRNSRTRGNDRGREVAPSRGGRGRGRGRGGASAPPPPPPPGLGPAGNVQPAPVPPAAGQQTPQVPVPGVAKQAVPQLTIEEAIDEWCRAYTIRIPKSLQSTFKELNIPYQIVSNGPGGPNAHALLAAYRTLATVYTLALLVKLKHRVIDLWYGSQRDVAVIRFLNSFLESKNFGPDYVTVHQIHAHVVPHDLFRRPDHVQANRVAATAAFFLDVYCHGPADDPIEIDPTWVSSLPYVDIAWVGHPFYGYYGAVASAAWLREEDTVYWSPDAVNDVYPPHPAADAMHSSGANGRMEWKIAHDWHHEGAVVYNLVSFHQSTMVATPRTCHVIRNQVMKTSVPDYDHVLTAWWAQACIGPLQPALFGILASGWFDRILPKKEVVVNLRHVQEARGFLSSRTLSSYTLQSLITQVRRSCTGDPEWALVNERFPAFFNNYAEEVALAAMVSDAKGRSLRYGHVRGNFAQHFSSANESMKQIDRPLEQGTSYARYVLAGALMTSIALTRRARRKAVSPLAFAIRDLLVPVGTGRVMKSTPREVVEAVCDIAQDTTGNVARATGNKLAQFVIGLTECIGRVTLGVFRMIKTYITESIVVEWVSPKDLSPAENLETFSGHLCVGADALAVQYEFPERSPEVLAGLVTMTCILGPIGEEAFKRTFSNPLWKAISSALLTWGDASGVAMTPVDLACQFGMHLSWALLPARYGIPAHMIHNLWVLWEAGDLVVREEVGPRPPLAAVPPKTLLLLLLVGLVTMLFKRMKIKDSPKVNCELAKVDEVAKDRLPTDMFRYVRTHSELTPYPVEQAEFPRLNIPDYPYPELADNIHMTDTLPEDDDWAQPSTRSFFRWFAHSVPLFVPNKSVNNLRKMVYFRLLRKVEPYHLDQWLAASVFMRVAVGGCLLVGTPHPRARALLEADLHGFANPQELLAFAPRAPAALVPDQPGDLAATLETDALVMQWIEIMDKWKADILFDQNGELIHLPPQSHPRISMNVEVWSSWRIHCDQAKIKRYDTAWEKVSHSPLSVISRVIRTIQVNQKEDEALIKIPDAEGLNWLEKGAISRPIHAVDPEVAVTIGPFVYEATERFKKDFWLKRVGSLQWSPIYVTMGAGRVDYELNEWWRFAMDVEGWHLIVAGDDMLLIYNAGSHVCVSHNVPQYYFVEGDLSQCDHSSRLGTMINEMTILSHYGVPSHIIELMLANARADLVVGLRNKPGDAIHIVRGYERNTGGTDTTIGNSLTSIAACLYTLMSLASNPLSPTSRVALAACGCDAWCSKTTEEKTQLFVKDYSTLGLTLKVRVTQAHDENDVGVGCRLPTFLKGAWLPVDVLCDSEFRRAWGPLPSRLLKMGKTLSDPCRIMKRNPKEHLSLEVALRRYAAALTFSMRAYAWPEPIARWLSSVQPPVADLFVKNREFQERFRASLKGDMYVLSEVDPEPSRTLRLAPEALAMYARYYDVPLELWTEFLAQLQDLRPFTFFAHPVWYALATDYA